MPPPILTLTTDFGLSDHYVACMKGVILGICPRARIIDISHQVTPYAIAEGAFLIARSYRYFPAGTVHVVVIDPGVGSARRPILLEAAGQYFVAPDNGVLSFLFEQPRHKVRLLSNDRYFHQPVSQTFHGRDIFAPVAAHVATGVKPARVGPILKDYIRPPFTQPSQTAPRSWSGHILKIDHFGNVVTNFRAADFPAPTQLSVGQGKARRLVRSYADAKSGELIMIAGSSGYLELSLPQASAAARLHCHSGDACQLHV